MGNTANDGMRSPEWYRPRIAYLSQFILPERFETFRQVLSMRTRWMTVCMENTFHPQNASAIIRNCEAFGIQDIHTVETLCPFSPNTHIVKGTDKWIDLHRHADTAGALAALRGAGYRLIATTPHSGDTSPEAFDVSQSPFVLIFGTEHAGDKRRGQGGGRRIHPHPDVRFRGEPQRLRLRSHPPQPTLLTTAGRQRSVAAVR